MDRLAELQALIASDPQRMRVLALVHALDLPDCWVGAGFVRNRVWDHLHARPVSPLPEDIDVVWYDSDHCTPERDRALESMLSTHGATLAWSVKNQARMHGRNGDLPYASAPDAMRYWPETATAVGVRLDHDGAIEVAAPFGLHDLFDAIVRPTPRFATDKQPLFLERVRAKRWLTHWPGLQLAAPR